MKKSCDTTISLKEVRDILRGRSGKRERTWLDWLSVLFLKIILGFLAVLVLMALATYFAPFLKDPLRPWAQIDGVLMEITALLFMVAMLLDIFLFPIRSYLMGLEQRVKAEDALFDRLKYVDRTRLKQLSDRIKIESDIAKRKTGLQSLFVAAPGWALSARNLFLSPKDAVVFALPPAAKLWSLSVVLPAGIFLVIAITYFSVVTRVLLDFFDRASFVMGAAAERDEPIDRSND